MASTNQKLSMDELLIDRINNSSANDWDKLCNECASLVKEAGMTNEDIDMIVEKVRKGVI